ncbi:MAG: ABC transporter permease, partial [Planctomycetia bacterium]
MEYAIQTIWFERKRYLPGVVAVAFSAVLIALQAGIFWGLVSVVAVPIDNSTADLWVMFPNTVAADLARPIPNYWRDRLWSDPGVADVDQYI